MRLKSIRVRGLDPYTTESFVDFEAIPGELVAVIGGNGQGKCLASSTLLCDVLTGMTLSVKDWAKEYKSGRRLCIAGRDVDLKLRPARVSAIEYAGRKPIVRVHLASGHSEDVSTTHPVITARGPIAAGSLARGDWVEVPRRLPVEQTHDVTPFTDADIILWACLLTEGSLTGSPIYGFTNGEKSTIDVMNLALDTRHLRLVPNTKNGHKGLQWRLKAKIDNRVAARRELVRQIVRVCDGLHIPLPCTSSNRLKVRAGEQGLSYESLITLSMQYGDNKIAAIADELFPHERLRRDATLLGLHEKLAKHKDLPNLFYLMSEAQVRIFLRVVWACDGYVASRKGGSGNAASLLFNQRA